MKAVMVFLVIPGAMLLYTLLVTEFGYFEQWPMAPLLLITAAHGALLWMLLRSRPMRKSVLILNCAGLILTALFLWWTQVFSRYTELEPVHAIGADVTKELSVGGLVDASGRPFDLPAAVGSNRATLLVFFRGHW